MMEFTSIKDGLPTLGMPLVVKTKDNMDGGRISLKYPCYYIKDAYTGCYEWLFFPMLEGVTKLLPSVSEVIAYAYIRDEDQNEKPSLRW